MHLSISESMYVPFTFRIHFPDLSSVRQCLGTGRTPVSELSKQDQDMLDLSSLPEFSLSAVREYRLALIARMFDMVETALKLRLESAADLGHFFEQINESIYSLEGLSRLFAPLPGKTQA
jgi:hypothetical protein